MAVSLRAPSFVLAALASIAFMGCPPAPGTDTGPGTDASDVPHDTGVVPGDAQDVAIDVPGGDAGNGCPAAMIGACNLITNAGCGAGSMCVLSDNGSGGVTSACTTVGTLGAGAPCSSGDACIQGLACLGSPGRCVKLCCGPGDNDTCRTGPGGMTAATCSTPITDLPIYGCLATFNCDWFLQDCPSGGNCRPIDTSGTATCDPAGTGTAGTPCGGSTSTTCAQGFACIQTSSPDGGSSAATCHQVCDPSATGDAGTDGGFPRTCPTGSTCGRVTGTPTNYGVCIAM